MANFKVIPELRSRGIRIDLAAWYPWRDAQTGLMCFDSTGIFVINKTATYQLVYGLRDLHSNNATGLCWEGCAANGSTPLDTYSLNEGPGKPNNCYLPKTETVEEKLRANFIVSSTTDTGTNSAVAGNNARADARGTGNMRMRPCLRWKEKRLEKAKWLYNGNIRKVAHYPSCFFHKQRRPHIR